MAETAQFPYCGKTFLIEFENGLKVKNEYLKDGKTLVVEFLSGETNGMRMTVPYRWKALTGGNYIMSWQEEDRSTVVHCDNFEAKTSQTFYTTMSGDFYVMSGTMQ